MKRIIFIIVALMVVASSFLILPQALAATPVTSCPGTEVPTEFGCIGTFGQYFSKVLVWLVDILSVVAVLMAIYVGILYMTSMGNSENLEKAKTLIFSVIFGIGLLFLMEVLIKILGIRT